MDIKIKHLGKAYGEQQILKDFSCLFPEGKTTCIRGQSGCGKTTLLRLQYTNGVSGTDYRPAAGGGL